MEAKLLDAVEDQRRRGFEAGVDQDVAGRRDDQVRREVFAADVVEVVGDAEGRDGGGPLGVGRAEGLRARGQNKHEQESGEREAASHGGGASFGRSSDKCMRPAGSMRFSVNWRHEQANEMSQQELVLILFQVMVLMMAFAVHESAHAYVAMRLGDPTAYMLGRVTLNPLKHLDPWGSVAIPLMSLYFGGFLIGWAKPCPVTTRNFRHIKRDDILTSLAGPASNLAMATVALLLLIVFKHAVAGGVPAIETAMALAQHVPVDTSAGLPTLFPIAMLLYYAVFINLLLFVFNLIPIPPLDGSHVLRQFLPYKVEQVYNQIGMYGLLLIFFFGGRFIGTLYYPLLGVFDGLLMAL
jgi:Zn-dependent protease